MDTVPHTLPCTLHMQLQNMSVILQKYSRQMKYSRIKYCINTHYTLGKSSVFRTRRSDVMSSDECVLKTEKCTAQYWVHTLPTFYENAETC